MKSSIEKKIEKKVGKNIAKDIKKEVEKEVKKKIYKIVYEKTKNSALRFKEEFKKHTITGITAAFAFLIALSWRNPIQDSVNQLIKNFGLIGKQIYIEYLSAIVITLIAVLVLILISKWEVEK